MPEPTTHEPTPHEPSRRRPAARYGDRPPVPRRTVVLALGLLAAVCGAWVVWAGLGIADRDVRWNDVGYTVVGTDRVDVRFEVIKDPDATAVCTVTALSAGYATVGIATVEVGPAPEQVVPASATVRTQELAVTGVVDECVVP